MENRALLLPPLSAVDGPAVGGICFASTLELSPDGTMRFRWEE